MERLQGLLDQERLTNQDMESLGEELLKEKQSLEKEMHALRAEKDRQVMSTCTLWEYVVSFCVETKMHYLLMPLSFFSTCCVQSDLRVGE